MCLYASSVTLLVCPAVAPAQTLTDKEYQRLRDASLAIIREMGVECGGSNVQMAINPVDGEAANLGGGVACGVGGQNSAVEQGIVLFSVMHGWVCSSAAG